MHNYIIIIPITLLAFFAYIIGCIQGYAKGAEEATQILSGDYYGR